LVGRRIPAGGYIRRSNGPSSANVSASGIVRGNHFSRSGQAISCPADFWLSYRGAFYDMNKKIWAANSQTSS